MGVTGDIFAGVVPFVAAAEELSFRGAARRLGVTPAAVSKAVARLEAELGVRLLERTSRHVSLTDDGAAFLARCRDAVAQMQAGREALSAARGVPRGELSLSLPHVLGRVVVPQLHRLCDRHPHLSVRVSFSDRFARMLDENVDVAVRIGELDSSSLVGRVLATSKWATVASPAYLAKRGTPRTPADLAAHACIRFLAPGGRPRNWDFDGASGHPVSGPLVVDHGEMLIEAALAGIGIVQVFDFMARDHVARGRLVEVLADHAVHGPKIRALCVPGRKGLPKVRACFGLLEEVFAGESSGNLP